MRIALFVCTGLDVAALLWLLFVFLRGPRKLAGLGAVLLPLPPCVLVAAILWYLTVRRPDPGPLDGLLLLWLLYTGGMIAVSVLRLKRAQTAANTQAQTERHFAAEAEYYDTLAEKQEQTRALRHDIEKYLRAAAAETDAAAAIEQARRALADASDLIDVGNRVLNVILNEYRVKAAAAHVRLDLQVQVPETLFVSVADLYILLSNTLDNAIEACAAVRPAERIIDLSLRQQHDVLFYGIANPYDGSPAKPARGLHGYGLKNGRACVKRYGGAVCVAEEDGQFRLTAHLNDLRSARDMV